MYVSATGYTAARRRVTGAEGQRRFEVALELSPAEPATLATVQVRAKQREAPTRNDGDPALRSGVESVGEGVASAVAPMSGGDPLAIAAAVPGLRVTPDGISAAGLPATQTLTTINGMAAVGAEVPRGLPITTRVATTAWDVARGGFSGAQVDVGLTPGFIYRGQSWVTSLSPAATQRTNEAGRAVGLVQPQADLNLALSGPVATSERFAYSLGARVRQRTADATPLDAASPTQLLDAGVSPANAATMLTALGSLGVPVTGPGLSQRTDVQFAGRVDRMSLSPSTFQPVPRTFGAVFMAGVSDERTAAAGPRATATTGASSRDANGALQLVHSLRSRTWLHDTKGSMSVRTVATDAEASLPAGLVLTPPTGPEGGIIPLTFGGRSTADRRHTRTIADLLHVSSTYLTPGAVHGLRLIAQVRVDRLRDDAVPNARGTFVYHSLDDLVANRPAAFTRTTAWPLRDASSWNAALGIGATYRPSPLFALEYGFRVDGGGFGGRPAANPDLAQRLGERTNVQPTSIGVSPRIGFRWVHTGSIVGGGRTFTGFGQYQNEVRGVVRGGIGLFRNAVTPDLMASARAADGRAGSLGLLSCVGAASPVPDWRAIAASGGAIPTACVGGASSLAQLSPAVTLLDAGWRPPESWRASLGWSGHVAGIDVSVDALASLDQFQSVSLDRNFDGTLRGTLPAEGGRPFFAPVALVDQATGRVSPLAARRDAAYGVVRRLDAAGRSRTAQMQLSLQPNVGRHGFLRATYVLSGTQALENGFDRNTDGDPRRTEWATSDLDRRHQVVVQGGLDIGRVSVSVFVNAFSGLPFTPLVAGDANGDGLSGNDRAFVTRAPLSDIAGTATMGALLDAAPSRIRSCLASTLERIAPRNACRGPWSTTVNAQVGTTVPIGRTGHRARVSLFLENPLGLVDQALHGEALRGWGAPAVPDPVLYTTRAFDATTNRFRYDVNARFGRTTSPLAPVLAPFRATFDVSIPFGPTIPEQQLSRALRPGRVTPGVRLDSATLHRRYARNVRDPFAAVLGERDSLLLTAAQIRDVQAAQAQYLVRVDSVWASLAAYLAALGDRYDARAALVRQEAAVDAAWEVARQESRAFDRIMNRYQLPLLPWPADYLRTLPPGIKIRAFAP